MEPTLGHALAIGLHFVEVTVTYLCVFILIMRLYRSHGYLFQVGFSRRNLRNWIELSLPLARRIRAPSYRQYLAATLPSAGLARHWDEDSFIAFQISSVSVTITAGYLLLSLILGMPGIFLLMAAVLVLALPVLKISELARARLLSCRRDLSYFLDYLSLAVSAGMEFTQALGEVVTAAPKSYIRDEFEQMERELKLGKSKSEALSHMEQRLPSPEVKVFVQNMIQALKLGTDMANTLATISNSFNQKRFQRAEEQAGKISVRMMIPMLVFVLPVVLLIIIGPMMLSFLNLS